jgi:putative glycosyltransferase (TIGR04372 family)
LIAKNVFIRKSGYGSPRTDEEFHGLYRSRAQLLQVPKKNPAGPLGIAMTESKDTTMSIGNTLWKKTPAELLYLVYVNSFGLLLSIGLCLVKPFRTVKLIEIRSHSIGQQAGNTGLFLRRLQLENKQNETRIQYIGIASSAVDNQQLFMMFRRKFFIIKSDFLVKMCGNGAFLIRRLGFFKDLPFETNEYDEFSSTEPDLSFTPDEEEKGMLLLRSMGVDATSFFICFHCRDNAFVKSYGGDFRNADIRNYLGAARYISDRGGYAIRMGYKVAEPLPDMKNPRIIDYASNFRTDFGDIFLPAKCKFFLASTAGPFMISTLFNVPVAAANFIPFYTPLRKGDLFIPKKIWSVEEQRFLTFREFIDFSGDIPGGNIRQGVDTNIYVQNKFAEGKYVAVENTAEEILDLAQEMNERLDGTFVITEEDEELQKRFQALLQPHHHCYGTPARVGAKFLRDNRDLIT